MLGNILKLNTEGPSACLLIYRLVMTHGRMGWGNERKGLVPKNLAEQSSERRNMWGFLIE
jgi:hypothetical protein